MRRAGPAILVISIMLAGGVWSAPAAAHPGRLAADGCHRDRSTGQRHCHGSGSATPAKAREGGRSAYYSNCSQARAAGAAPIRRGEPGYASKLDRDGDGIACE